MKFKYPNMHTFSTGCLLMARLSEQHCMTIMHIKTSMPWYQRMFPMIFTGKSWRIKYIKNFRMREKWRKRLLERRWVNVLKRSKLIYNYINNQGIEHFLEDIMYLTCKKEPKHWTFFLCRQNVLQKSKQLLRLRQRIIYWNHKHIHFTRTQWM